MISDALLKYAGKQAEEHVLGRLLVQGIEVWGARGSDGFLSIRINFIAQPHHYSFGKDGGSEWESIPGYLLAPLSAKSSRALVQWVILRMAGRAEKRAAKYAAQPGSVKVIPLDSEGSCVTPTYDESHGDDE